VGPHQNKELRSHNNNGKKKKTHRISQLRRKTQTGPGQEEWDLTIGYNQKREAGGVVLMKGRKSTTRERQGKQKKEKYRNDQGINGQESVGGREEIDGSFGERREEEGDSVSAITKTHGVNMVPRLGRVTNRESTATSKPDGHKKAKKDLTKAPSDDDKRENGRPGGKEGKKANRHIQAQIDKEKAKRTSKILTIRGRLLRSYGGERKK